MMPTARIRCLALGALVSRSLRRQLLDGSVRLLATGRQPRRPLQPDGSFVGERGRIEVGVGLGCTTQSPPPGAVGPRGASRPPCRPARRPAARTPGRARARPLVQQRARPSRDGRCRAAAPGSTARPRLVRSRLEALLEVVLHLRPVGPLSVWRSSGAGGCRRSASVRLRPLRRRRGAALLPRAHRQHHGEDGGDQAERETAEPRQGRRVGEPSGGPATSRAWVEARATGERRRRRRLPGAGARADALVDAGGDAAESSALRSDRRALGRHLTAARAASLAPRPSAGPRRRPPAPSGRSASPGRRTSPSRPRRCP
jgi:hypothetical protein